MKIVEVKRYGDFDIPQTESVWANENISQNQELNLPDCSDDRDSNRIRRYLKSIGFKKVNTSSVTVGGNF